MSKLMTDSATLMNWLTPGVNPEDNALCNMIKELSQTVIDVAIIQGDLDDQQADILKRANIRTARVLNELQNLKNEFQDILRK